MGRPERGPPPTSDDADAELEELEEFDPEELFEDDDATNQPKQTGSTTEDAAAVKEITDFNRTGEQYFRLGMWQEAEQAFRDTLALVDESLGPHHPTATVILNNLAMTCRQRGNLEEAEQLLQQVLSLRREFYGPVHPRVALAMDHLGSVYQQQQRNEEALELFRQSLDIVQSRTETGEHSRGDGDDWDDLIDLATAQNNLGLAYYKIQDYGKAEALFRSAVQEARQRELEHEESERRGEAGEEQAMGVSARRCAVDSLSSSAVMRKNLALCLLKQGKLDQSESEFKLVLDHLREEVGLREHDAPIVDLFRHLGRLYSTMGKPDESAFYLDKVARIDQANKQATSGQPS